jgi:predicted RNA-binding Zn ribbon-like protein
MGTRAPGPLGLVQEFVNTLDVEEAEEQLDTPYALGAWLAERRLLEGAPPVTAADLARALQLRESLRHLLLTNNGGPLRESDLAMVNDMAAEFGLRPRILAGGQVRLEPALVGVRGALGKILAAACEAMREGTWSRLKACGQDSCQWAFYDRSRNRSGHWCSMEVCGNRAKARQFRQRRRSGA